MRGLEFPVLLTISTNGYNIGFASTRVLDAWTRVTASLFIIHMENQYSAVTQGLIGCIRKQVARQSEEQEEIKYNFLKRLYFFLQTPLFCYIVIILILGYVFTDYWLRPYGLDFLHIFLFFFYSFLFFSFLFQATNYHLFI